MAGIYIHIPFCRQACNYCNFHFATSLHYKNEMVDALLKEIELRKEYLQNDTVETIYFGGGTPSLLSVEECKSMIDGCRSQFNVPADAEITLEANPDDITDEKLSGWKHAGINRLSIGVQSFFEEDLQWMNRAHNAQQAISSLQSAIKHFNNITIDLIYGHPLLTDEKWKQNVDTVTELGIPHISCYALTVEPKTPLDKLIREHKKEDVEPDKQARQFLLLMDWLGAAGYEHYEISNFAKPGKRSRHNSSYWSGKKYLGIGPSAHSFDGETRQWNVANNKNYIDSIEKEIIPAENEVLTATQKLNEYIMTSLRTMEGLDLRKVRSQEPACRQSRSVVGSQEFISKTKKFIDTGKMINENGFLKLTREGKLFADGIAAELFF
jgi:oxygen-independent coproporphyrinogen-3 oxidase